jgi:hypothetical protein
MAQNLTFENIKADAENLILTENDSYIQSYSEFIKYFEDIDLIEKHHLFIASHFVYGWMPTIIQLNTKQIDKVLILLNKAKSLNLLNADELEIVKNCVNNSLVGTSKLLHFINPSLYAIWDSRIFRYITDKKSSYGIDKPKAYLEYLIGLKNVANNAEYNNLHSKIERNFNYQISPMRAIEIIMFETDRNRHKNRKN